MNSSHVLTKFHIYFILKAIIVRNNIPLPKTRVYGVLKQLKK